jgi:hypothetical protein
VFPFLPILTKTTFLLTEISIVFTISTYRLHWCIGIYIKVKLSGSQIKKSKISKATWLRLLILSSKCNIWMYLMRTGYGDRGKFIEWMGTGKAGLTKAYCSKMRNCENIIIKLRSMDMFHSMKSWDPSSLPSTSSDYWYK